MKALPFLLYLFPGNIYPIGWKKIYIPVPDHRLRRRLEEHTRRTEMASIPEQCLLCILGESEVSAYFLYCISYESMRLHDYICLTKYSVIIDK